VGAPIATVVHRSRGDGRDAVIARMPLKSGAKRERPQLSPPSFPQSPIGRKCLAEGGSPGSVGNVSLCDLEQKSKGLF
jgi:hypothetical protein